MNKEKKTAKFSDGVKRHSSGSFIVRLLIDGKPVERRFPTKQEALNYREEIRKRKLARSLGFSLPAAPILPEVKTLGKILDNYEDELRIAGRSKASIATVKQVRTIVKEWKGLGHPAELRREDFKDLILWLDLNREAGRRSLHKHAIICIRTAMKIADIPLPSVPAMVLPTERKQRTMKPDELRVFLGAMKDNSPEKVAAFIALYTGARQEEIYRLKFEDVNLEAGTIRLERHKRRATARPKIDIVPVHPTLEKILRAYLKAIPQGLKEDDAFIGIDRGKHKKIVPWHPIGRGVISGRLKTSCLKAGIPVRRGIGFFRHEFATLSRASGVVSLQEAAKALSHGSSAVTQRHYDESGISDRVAFEASLKAAEAVSQALGMSGPEEGGEVN